MSRLCRDCGGSRCAKLSRRIRICARKSICSQSIVPPQSKEWQATFRNLRDSAARLFELTPDVPEQARATVLQHRRSGAAGRFSRAESQYRCRAKAGDPRGTRSRETAARGADEHLGAARDRADPAEIAEGCAVAIFRCATSRLFARAAEGDPARAGRRRDRRGRTGRAAAHATGGSETAGRCAGTGRARIEAARFHSAGQSGVFRDRQLHRDDRGTAVVEIERRQSRSRQGAARFSIAIITISKK